MVKKNSSMLLATSFIAAGGLLGGISTANAAVIVLDFEGLQDFEAVKEFYNGGVGSLGSAGTNYGVSFSPATLAIIDTDAGGSGNFANEPSPDTIMFFLNANDAILNFAAGFDTGFSFFYSSSTAASVNVYDDVNATGNLLASLNLSAQGFDNCTGDPTGSFCNWTPIGVAFAGIAKSIDFGGTADQTGFDDITFGSSTPGQQVPEPTSLALLGLGLAGLGFVRRRRT
jgi:hypothetical protein